MGTNPAETLGSQRVPGSPGEQKSREKKQKQKRGKEGEKRMVFGDKAFLSDPRVRP